MLAAFRDGVLVGLLEFDRVDAARTMVWKLYVDPDAQRPRDRRPAARAAAADRRDAPRSGSSTTPATRPRRRSSRASASPSTRSRTAPRARAPCAASGASAAEVLLDDPAQAGVDDVGAMAERRAVAEPLEQVEAPVRRAVGDLAHARRRRLDVVRERDRVDRDRRSRAGGPRSRSPGTPATGRRASARRGARSRPRRAAGSAPRARRRRAPRRGSRASRSGRSRSRRAGRRRRDGARSPPPPTRG